MPSDGPVGDAFTDANNPIRKIWRGQRLDLRSLKPPVNETVPTLDGVTWANPIDAFISEKLVESGMAHSPETDRRTLIRPGPAAIEPPRPETTGRRLALGNWIVSPDNPWTVRVFVNRVWQQHSGIGLVTTPNDYGCSGVKPTPPELLDWLAIAFIQRGWSVKQLHRLVVTSATYRQSSRDRDEARKIDPENHLLWQQNIQRLAAETRRDRLLAVSGVLKREGGGRAKWPNVPEELLYAQPGIQEAIKGEDGGRMQGWFTDPAEVTDVRSLYLVRKRCLPIPFLQAFDLSDPTVSCARRDTTVVAPQALMLLNSEESVRNARVLAGRLREESSEPRSLNVDGPQIIQRLFRLALCRSPDAEEQRLALEFLKSQEQQHRTSGQTDATAEKAIVDLCRAVLNLNEFAYYDRRGQLPFAPRQPTDSTIFSPAGAFPCDAATNP